MKFDDDVLSYRYSRGHWCSFDCYKVRAHCSTACWLKFGSPQSFPSSRLNWNWCASWTGVRTKTAVLSSPANVSFVIRFDHPGTCLDGWFLPLFLLRTPLSLQLIVHVFFEALLTQFQSTTDLVLIEIPSSLAQSCKGFAWIQGHPFVSASSYSYPTCSMRPFHRNCGAVVTLSGLCFLYEVLSCSVFFHHQTKSSSMSCFCGCCLPKEVKVSSSLHSIGLILIVVGSNSALVTEPKPCSTLVLNWMPVAWRISRHKTLFSPPTY